VRDEENNNFKLEFDFGQEQSGDAPTEVDFSGQQPIGNCPKCGAGVYEQPLSYLCEHTPPKKCDFRSGKIILRQEVTRAQMQKLLATGKTDLLEAFVSNRTGRKFKAFLVKQPDGKIGFEFAPRALKTPAKAKSPVRKTTRRSRKTTSS
jgi:DNA topoisomerase-3